MPSSRDLKLLNKNPEFYFTSGMYNYYVEVYPEEHPIVKPLLVFFKNGDKALGLKQIDTATKVGTITKAESCYYISHIYLKYEAKPEKAAMYMEKLSGFVSEKPYLSDEARGSTMLLSGKYDQAHEKALQLLRKQVSTGFYPAAWRTFQGILEEKDRKNDAAAQKGVSGSTQNAARRSIHEGVSRDLLTRALPVSPRGQGTKPKPGNIIKNASAKRSTGR
jgi:hypothetical protein